MSGRIDEKEKSIYLPDTIIVGAGIAGLAAATYLQDKGAQVTLIDPKGQGGLAGTFSVCGTELEYFYHHIFYHDTYVLDLIKKYHLEQDLYICPSSVCIYDGQKTYPFNSAWDLLNFSPLPFLERLRFGLQALYFQWKQSWDNLDQLPLETWDHLLHSPQLQKSIWGPLLYKKFNYHSDQVAVSWLWGRIHERTKSRKRGKEKLLYLKGSFGKLHKALYRDFHAKGGVFIKKPLTEMIVSGDKITHVQLANGRKMKCERLLTTVSNRILSKMIPTSKAPYYQSPFQVKDFGVSSLVFISKEPFAKYYWMNNTDWNTPFGGVINQTQLIGPEHYQGKHISYVFNYLPPSHPFLGLTSNQLWQIYHPYLKNILPGYSRKNILEVRHFTSPCATPLYTRGHEQRKIPIQGAYANLFHTNMSQIYPQDRNMNHSIKEAYQMCDKVLETI